MYPWYGASLYRTIIYIGVELEKINNCHPKIEDLNGVMALTVNGDNFGQFTAINSWYLSIMVFFCGFPIFLTADFLHG